MFRYVDEAATLCPEIIPSIYNEAKTIRSNTEDPFYYSARFFDKIIGKNYEESELDGRGEIIFHIISQYVRSLMHGCCHLHQSLARLLTVRLNSRLFCFTSPFQLKSLANSFFLQQQYCRIWALMLWSFLKLSLVPQIIKMDTFT